MDSQVSQADQVSSPTKGKKGQKPQEGNFTDCFRFASKQDYVLLFFGLVLAVFNGAAMACFGLVIGLAINTFDTRYTEAQARDYSNTVVWYFVALGVVIFFGTFGSRTLLRLNARRQGYNIRKAYLSALLKKEISYFDEVNPMEVSSQVENDCKTIVDTLDVKLESIVFTMGALGAGIITAFARSWQITLMVFVAVPFIVGSMVLYIFTIVKAAGQRSRAYSKAGGIAEESLSHIRTVVSLSGEKAEVTRYDNAVKEFQTMLSKSGIYQGMASGVREMLFFLLAGIIFYIGSYKIENEVRNPTTGKAYIASDIFTPISAIYVSFSQLPLVATSLKAINNAKVKIKKILDVIDSIKDEKDANKETIEKFKGGIEFKNVTFAFPNRKDKTILDNLSFNIKPGKKIAFVGESGSGKSTIIQLLQGFYEPQEGSVLFDGKDLKKLDKAKLREQIAYVGQEPIIFSLSIRENLLLAKEDATEDELISALKKANAHKFVMHMDKKMDTPIGGSTGAQLSGGQKQRIAIARAILRDAKILLLDEATSALDRLSEKQIQETLDNLEGQRTMILIAHRLSTIQTADQIIVLDQGKVVEVGTHEELLEKQGKYHSMHAEHVGVDTKTELGSSANVEKKEAKKDKKAKQDEEEDENEEEDEDTALLKAGSPSQQRNRSEEEEKKLKKEEKERQKVTFADCKKLWGMVKTERKYFFLGLLGSLGAAMATPASHVLMSGSLDTLVNHDDPDFRDLINMYCILMLSVSVLVFIFYTLEVSLFAKASETLIQRLRVDIFYKFLRMHMGWHDQPENTPGNLAASLEVDTANVGQLTGTSLGLIIQIALTNLFALIVAFVASWQLTLIGMWIVPVVLLVAVLLSSNEAKGGEASAEPLHKAEVIVSEVLNNMKTVISMNANNKFLKEYTEAILRMEQAQFKVRVMNGVYEGAMNLVLYFALAGMYYVGVHLFFTLDLSPMRIFLAVFGLALTAFFSTQMFYLMPDTGRAIHSVRILLDHLERKSEIDIEDKENKRKDKIQGNIEFRNVKFSFPTRPVEIFSDLNFKIEAGKNVGITGPSGCGKSTIVQLLYRFYDVSEGEVLIEGINIQEYDLQYLRKKIGGVFQEPVLFNETIEYNLKYANEEVSQSEMRDACEKANAMRFIEAKPQEGKKEGKKDKEDEDKEDKKEGSSSEEEKEEAGVGFQRVVGSKGGQLSGGQKQRIAIARAILRKPKVVLLDEATSALDSKSESAVQDALNKASKGLTTICIAHRFSTIKEMDEILVLEGGQIVEKGTYDQLIEKKGRFYHLKEGEDL